MKIEHSHSIDSEKYSVPLAKGAVSFNLDDSVSIKLTLADIRYLIGQGVDFNINLDEWSSAVEKTTRSIVSIGIDGSFRHNTIANVTYGFAYDDDYQKFMFYKGDTPEEDKELLKVLKIELELKYPSFLKNLDTLRYINNPVELENIHGEAKVKLENGILTYVNKGFSVVLDKEYTEQIINDTKVYFDKYAKTTFDRIENQKEKREFTLDFVKNEGLEMAQKMTKKDSITVDDLKKFIEFFYGEDSFEIF